MAGKFMGSRLPAASRYSREEFTGDEPQENEGAALALQAQQAMEEVLEAGEEVGELENDGEELANTYGEVLPEVQQILSDAQEAGGVSVEAVSLLAIIGGLTGTDLQAKVATESYGATGRSQQATRVAMEAVSDRLNGWWQALKRWLKKMWKKARDWWNKSFSGAAQVKASAEAMKKRAQGATNKTIKNEQVSFSGAVALINKDGKIDAASVKAGIAAVSQMADDIVLKYPKSVATAAKGFLDKAADLNMDAEGKDTQTALGAAYGEYKKSVAALLVDAGVAAANPKPSGPLGTNPMFDKNLGNAELALSPVLLGNRVIFAITRENDQSIGLAQAGTKAPEGDIEGKALGINDITGICDSIISTCDTLIRAGSSANDTGKIESELDKVGDKVERLVAQADKAEANVHKTSSVFQKMAKSIANSMNEPHNSFAAYAMNLSNVAIRYANASLSTAA